MIDLEELQQLEKIFSVCASNRPLDCVVCFTWPNFLGMSLLASHSSPMNLSIYLARYIHNLVTWKLSQFSFLQVHLNLTNQTDRTMGPFEVWLSQSDSREEQVVMVNGLRAMVRHLIVFILYLLSPSWSSNIMFPNKILCCICFHSFPSLSTFWL